MTKATRVRMAPARPLFLVMAGGALGAGARHLTGRAMFALLGAGFPYGTLAVNVIGGLAMGLLVGMMVRTGSSETWRLFLGVGVLGGFTTFSSFSLDAVNLYQRSTGLALGYVAVSVIGSIVALAVGLAVTRTAA